MTTLWNRKRQEGGFTLLELLMVVIIIAILASIALPQFIRAAEKARAAEAIQVLSALRSAQYRFKALNPAGQYGTLAQLDADLTAMTNWNAPVGVGAGAVTGMITAARKAGPFSGVGVNQIGIQLGSGTICGTFPPMGTAACVSD
jgi:prepilin-type N-terminal cleavage/methylation domain-containing protein